MGLSGVGSTLQLFNSSTEITDLTVQRFNGSTITHIMIYINI